jgi:hypothetical protein
VHKNVCADSLLHATAAGVIAALPAVTRLASVYSGAWGIQKLFRQFFVVLVYRLCDNDNLTVCVTRPIIYLDG